MSYIFSRWIEILMIIWLIIAGFLSLPYQIANLLPKQTYNMIKANLPNIVSIYKDFINTQK